MKDIVSIIKQISETIENADISKMWNGLEGKLGCSLFCFVMFQEFEDERFKTVGIHLLDKEVAEYNSMRGVYETFWSGFSGLFWLINFLLRSKSIKNDYDINLFDSTLLQFANRVMKKKNDYLNGSIGIFFSLISSTNKVSYYATQFVNLLSDNKIKKGNNKFCWVQDALHSNQYNLSLSHGMSSIVIMLSKIHQKGIEQEKCAELIEGAVNYILAQKLPQGNYNSIFGNYALESMEKPHSSRLAWCYGDLGIAVALWSAAQALGRKDWESEAKSILLHASQRRDLKDNYVMDACFCHGTSGIAHVFNRMWRETGMDECKHAAAYWIEQTLDMAKFTDGLAGYKTWQGGVLGYETRYGLLEGIAGIGLVLLSYYYEIEPTWDECLLLS